jgi:hypothetical protein
MQQAGQYASAAQLLVHTSPGFKQAGGVSVPQVPSDPQKREQQPSQAAPAPQPAGQATPSSVQVGATGGLQTSSV